MNLGPTDLTKSTRSRSQERCVLRQTNTRAPAILKVLSERPLPSIPQCWAKGGEKSYHYPIYSLRPTTITGGLVECYTNLSSRLKLKNVKLHNSKISLCSHSSKRVQSQTNLLTALLSSMLMASGTEEFRHASVLMTCKGTRKNILKALTSTNFMSGAVLSEFHAFAHLIFKSNAFKSYDYLYHFIFVIIIS